MRERIKIDGGKAAVVPSWYTVDGAFIINGPITYLQNRRYIGMLDDVVPDFRRRQKEGNLFCNPMWQLDININQAPLVVAGEGICSGARHKYEVADVIKQSFTQSTLQSTVDIVLDDFSDESEIAQTKAWADIDVSEIQGSASLGELPETVDWLVDRLKALAQLLLAIRRKDAKKLKKLFGEFKKQDGYLDLWLEYRYAIRPLISDIMAALKAISATLEKGVRFTARGRHSVIQEPFTTDVRLPYQNPDLADPSHGYMAHVQKSSYRLYRAGVLVEVDRSIDTGLAIWGLDNPLEAVWELISLSFVVDWIFNIGQVLSAVLLNPGLEPKISWSTETVVHMIETRPYLHVRDVPYGCSASITTHFLKETGYLLEEWKFKRRVPTAKRFSLPHLNVRLDASKILDIYSIARKLL